MSQFHRSIQSLSAVNCCATCPSASTNPQSRVGMRKPGSKERIRRFLLANIGNVVTSKQIRDAAGKGVSEWARRVRELREQEGWPIITHNDSADLKPGQYLLREKPPKKSGVAFAQGISARLRAEVLDRNGF